MISDDYSLRQDARDTEYESAYREWTDGLPPRDRERLTATGLDSPAPSRTGVGTGYIDVPDSPVAHCGADPAQEPEPDHSPVDFGHDDERIREVMRRMLGEVLAHDNARLTAECFALVSGLCYCGWSMTDIARRHGITRAAVSKRCVELNEMLGLRPSPAMRTRDHRTTYRHARLNYINRHEAPHQPPQPQGGH